MPKYRQLHTKIIDSFDFNEMPNDFTRVTWMLLSIILDREGRGIYNMAWIRSKMYPMRDDVGLEQLQGSFDWFIQRGMVEVYDCKGKDYFHIPTFKSYQTGTDKEAPSVLPVPPGEQATEEPAEELPDTTPELLRSYSEPTAELVGVNTMQIQDKSKAKQSKPPPAATFSSSSPDIQAERIYSAVTGHAAFPSTGRDDAIAAINALKNRHGDELVAYLKPYWLACKKRYPGNVRVFWLTDWAIAGVIPDGKKPEGEKPVEYQELKPL